MEKPEKYYERLRKQGLTENITSDPEPNYNESFYQNIFRLMEGYARLYDGKQLQQSSSNCNIPHVIKSVCEHKEKTWDNNIGAYVCDDCNNRY